MVLREQALVGPQRRTPMIEDDRQQPRKSSTVQFTYHDPSRTYDGTPYEAAGKAVAQTTSVVSLLWRALTDTTVQVRNAYMQRNLDLDGDANVEAWESSPEYKALQEVAKSMQTIQRKLKALHQASTYDPEKVDT